MNRDVIIACDFNSKAELMAFLDNFKDEERKPFLKVGMELYYAEDPTLFIIKKIKSIFCFQKFYMRILHLFSPYFIFITVYA